MTLLLLLRLASGFLASRSRPSVAFSWTTTRPYVATVALSAKPKRGSIVDSYQTISVNCVKCQNRLFRYKKKNGTKSNLVKCFVERIVEDPHGILEQRKNDDHSFSSYQCPNCGVAFARPTMIRGMSALKLAGGKVRMAKK